MYHLTEDGEPRICKATKGKCPYAADKHFTSKEDARASFEKLQDGPITSVSRTVPHEMELSAETTKLLNKLYAKGLNPYVVGGAVRDSMLSGATPKDIDIEVFEAKDMDQLESFLRKSGYRVDAVGKSFGVLKITLPDTKDEDGNIVTGDDIDISLPRRDSKKGDGHRGFDVVVDPTLSMEDAAGRRDFTINALYYSQRDKLVKDPHGGLEDYRQGQLRHINEHFDEDPLRVIRGAQFSARFKMKLNPETAEFCRSLRGEFSTIPTDRFQTEFEKMLSKGDVTYGLTTLKQTGWDEDLRLADLPSNAGKDANASIERAKSYDEDKTVFGASRLLKVAAKADRVHIASYMVTSDKRQKKALALAQVEGPKATNAKEIRAWARDIGKKSGLTVKDYYIATGNESVRAASLKAGSFEAPIPDMLTGAKVLQKTNQKPGPWLGNLLREAAKAQDDEVFTTDAAADAWLTDRLKTLGQ